MSDNSSVPLPSLNWDAVDQMNAYEEWYDFMNSYFVIKEVSDDKRYCWDFPNPIFKHMY